MTSINELVEAVAAVSALKDAVAKHETLLNGIIDRLDDIYGRLEALEKRKKATKR